jgi:hypothetical protein
MLLYRTSMQRLTLAMLVRDMVSSKSSPSCNCSSIGLRSSIALGSSRMLFPRSEISFKGADDEDDQEEIECSHDLC